MTKIIEKLKTFFKVLNQKIKAFLQKFPYWSLAIGLGLLLALATLSNFLTKPKIEKDETVQAPQKISTFRLGTNPTVPVQAVVEKTGVTKIIAQSGGTVQNINVKAGSKVVKGSRIAYVSTTASGASIPAVSKKIAQKNLDFQTKTYNLQKDIIEKQKELAEKQDENNDELREIQEDSLAQTQDSVELSREILNSINQQLLVLESNNADHSNDAEILQIKQSKVSVETGLASLEGALKGTLYQSDSSNPPAKLSNISKDLARKQLELQNQSLDLTIEIASLNLDLAQISESMLYPESPFTGVIERVYVRVGESINAGTVIASVKSNTLTAELVALIPSELARSVSRLEDSSLTIDGNTIKLKPLYISEEPTDGTLHSITFSLNEESVSKTSDGDYITIQLPVESNKSSSAVPFIPLDSLYQTKTDAYVYVVASEDEKNVARSKNIKVGEVVGSYIRVLEGLDQNDVVILDRNIISGDFVEERL